MKKCIAFILLICTSFLFASKQEDSGRDLCQFMETVFDILQDESVQQGREASTSIVERLKIYDTDSNPEIVELAEQFSLFLRNPIDEKEALVGAVSDLGRLLKCSVDNKDYRTDTPYLLHLKDLRRCISQIEAKIGERLPGKNTNFHKVMIESLVEEQYWLYLYASLKIAESRCLQ